MMGRGGVRYFGREKGKKKKKKKQQYGGALISKALFEVVKLGAKMSHVRRSTE